MIEIREVMQKRVVTAAEGRTVRSVAALMARRKIGSVVVVRKGKVVGILTERDVLRMVARGRKTSATRVRDVMTAPVYVTAAEADLEDAVKLMVLHNIKKLPVLRDGKLVGIVSMTDFARLQPLFHDLLVKAVEQAKKPLPAGFEKYAAPRAVPPGMYV